MISCSGQQVGVFLADVEQIGRMRPERAVADAVGRNDQPEIQAHRVDGAGAHAAAGRAAGEDDGVDALRRETPARWVPKKAEACVLRMTSSPGRGASAVDHLAGMRLLGQVAEARHLLAPDAAVRAVVGIDDAGEDDRAAPARGRRRGAARWRSTASAILPPPKTFGVGEAVDEVDDEQRRPRCRSRSSGRTAACVDPRRSWRKPDFWLTNHSTLRYETEGSRNGNNLRMGPSPRSLPQQIWCWPLHVLLHLSEPADDGTGIRTENTCR